MSSNLKRSARGQCLRFKGHKCVLYICRNLCSHKNNPIIIQYQVSYLRCHCKTPLLLSLPLIASAARTTPPPHLANNLQPPPPPPAPFTQAAATPSVFQQAPPTSTLQTQASFLTQGGLTSFGLVNPLQALQNILPSHLQHTQRPSIPLAYSTLNVSVAGLTRPSVPQPTYATLGMPSISPMLPGKTLLPTTPTVGGPGYVYTQPVQLVGNTVLGTQSGILTPPAAKMTLDPNPYRSIIPTPPMQTLNKPLLPGAAGRTPLMTPYQSSQQLRAQSPLTPMAAMGIRPPSQPRPQQPQGYTSINWMR